MIEASRSDIIFDKIQNYYTKNLAFNQFGRDGEKSKDILIDLI